MILTLLAILIAALVVLALVAGLLPRIAVTAAAAGICVLVVVALAVLASGTGATTLAVPIGPPGARMHLALDPLAASFLLLLFVVMPCAETAPLPLAATAVTVLAGDGFTMAVGLLLVGGVNSLRITAAAAVCLIAAFALAGPLGEFAALRAMPPEGLSAAAVLLLVLVGAGAMSRVSPVDAGLSGASDFVRPLRRWAADVVGCAAIVDGCLSSPHRIAARRTRGDAAHSGVPGFAAICSGRQRWHSALRCWRARRTCRRSRPWRLRRRGWRWSATYCAGRCCCGAPAQRRVGAGTRRADCLGGLIYRMPVTTGSCLVGLFAVAVLPPGLGFAAFWLLFQSLLAAARIGDPGLQGVDRRRRRIGRGIGRPGRPGRGAAVRRGLSRRSAHPPRRRRG